MSTHEQAAKHVADVLAGGAVVASLVGYLPAIAAFMGVLWYAVQIYLALENRFRRKRGKRTRGSDVQDFTT